MTSGASLGLIPRSSAAGSFIPVKIEDYKELIVEAEEKEEKKVLESDILQQADERINYLLSSYLQKVYGEDVEIKYEYLQY